ncbi:MAG TPA: hypothetical protein VJH55_03080 [Candidatus Paceibacterota bacterium]
MSSGNETPKNGESGTNRLGPAVRAALVAASIAFVSACTETPEEQIPTTTVAEIVANPSSFVEKKGKIRANVEKKGERTVTILIPVIDASMNIQLFWVGQKKTVFSLRDAGASGDSTPQMEAFISDSIFSVAVPILPSSRGDNKDVEITGKVTRIKDTPDGPEKYIFEIGKVVEKK